MSIELNKPTPVKESFAIASREIINLKSENAKLLDQLKEGAK